MHLMRNKIADYLLDISKLVFAGVVLSTILQIDGVPKWAVLLTGVYATFVIALVGFMLMEKK